MRGWFLISTAGITAGVAQASKIQHASTLTPPVLPLVVRNPYLSTWLGRAREEPWQQWPMFWTGEQIGFGVLASVPDSGNVYPLLGRPHDSLIRSDENYHEDEQDHHLDNDSHGRSYNVSFPTYVGAKYDASTTNLTYHIPSPHSNATNADYVKVILSFFSPITPQSTLRQALPTAYLTVLVEGSFDISIYIDLNGQWVSGDRESKLTWDLLESLATSSKSSSSLKTWAVKRRDELLFTETNDRAEWGTLYFTAPSDLDHESGTSASLRQRFAKKGFLNNRTDSSYRSIMDEEPVFAFAKLFRLSNKTLSNHGKSRANVTFTIAHVQDSVVQYASARGLTQMRPLWKSYFTTDSDLISFHYHDFFHAHLLARNYTDQLALDAYKSGSSNYADIVALSARQVLGATSFSGTPDNPLIFLKEISSNGNCQTVDVIFPAFPFFLYTNPRWGAYLLEPLLEHQLSGQYPNKYSMHDLGTHFPNQTGHADGKDEYMPVEECGDFLIMGLALVNALKYTDGFEAQGLWSSLGDSRELINEVQNSSAFPLSSETTDSSVRYLDDSFGGGSKGQKQARKWVRQSYRLWKQWTGYLVEYSLKPHNQLSTDDFAGWLALQTNLALKGIIGIRAMSELASIAGETKDMKYYKNISESYISKWEELGMSRDKSHAQLAYNWYGSWTTLYSLFADSLLCFHPSITGNKTSARREQTTKNHRPKAQRPLMITTEKEEEETGETSQRKDFIPHGIYKNQSTWYNLVLQKYGLPLDSRHLYTKSDWQFQAAAVSSPKVRKDILDRVARWINETSTDRPLTDLFETEGDGGWPGVNFMARPVVGSHFAFLALERACGVGSRGFDDYDFDGGKGLWE